ncbi:OmpH family outer membrane protein [Vaginella massiliensis]|uniref:OmpH family outer membrane protein n=1 Tax=Vaginella massiliensis TaxID=1816680 RepID=UPI003753CA02
MKKLIFLVLLFIGLSNVVTAQRFCYVDTEYILNNYPAYTNAQSSLKRQTEAWQKELELKKEALQKMQAEFEAEKILLTDEQVKAKQAKIDEESNNIRVLQDKRYGPEGDLLNLRKSLVKPIQDQIYNATKQVADRLNYSFVFDKGSDLIMVYTDPRFDISREVLKILVPEKFDIKTTNNTTNNTNNRNNTKTTINNRNNTNKAIKK